MYGGRERANDINNDRERSVERLREEMREGGEGER